MTGTVRLLAAAAAIQLLLTILTHREPSPTIAALQPLVPDFESGSWSTIRIQSDSEDSKEPTTVVVRRQGEQWLLETQNDFEAKPDKVLAALQAIQSSQYRRPLTTNAARHKQLRVADDEFERKVVLEREKETLTIYIGRSAGRARTAIRLEGSETVVAVTGLKASTFSSNPVDWVDRDYRKVIADEVVGIDVSNDHGSFSFARRGEDWAIQIDGASFLPSGDEELDASAIDRVTRALTSISLIAPGARAGELGSPAVTARLRTAPTSGSGGEEVVYDIFVDADTTTVHERGRSHGVVVAKTAIAPIVDLQASALKKTKNDEKEAPTPGQPPMPPALPSR